MSKLWLVLMVMGEVTQVWGPLPVSMDECLMRVQAANEDLLLQQGRRTDAWFNQDKPEPIRLACMVSDIAPLPHESHQDDAKSHKTSHLLIDLMLMRM